MMKWMRILMMLVLAVMLAFTGVACDNGDGGAEEAGEAIDEAAEDLKDGAEDVGEAIKDTAEDLKDN